MADYERITLLQDICTNLGGSVEEGSDLLEIRILRGIVAAEEGEAGTGDYERIELLRAWHAASGESEVGTDDLEEIELLRAIGENYSAEVAEGSDYEAVRILRAIDVATEPPE